MSNNVSGTHHSSLITRHVGTRRPIRLLIAALIALTVAASYYRYRFERRRAEAPGPLIASVRRQLGLAPVLAAEEALSARPNDPQLRLRLANACAATGDPVGAALALEPLLDRIGGIDRMGNGQLVARFVR